MKKGIQFLLVICFALTLMGCQSEKKEEVKEEKQVEKEPEVKKTEITLSFVGDITLGNYAGQGYEGSFDQEYEKQGKDCRYFLKNVKSVFDKDDLTIANLEGPLTTSQDYAEKTFAFKGKPEYVDILTEGSVEAVTLANNHSRDHFEQGMEDTKEVLDQKDIKHFGYDESCIVDVKGIKIGFLGYSFPYEFTAEMKKAITDLKTKSDLVIIYYHWGIERDAAPMDSQRRIAKESIDAGADLIIGSHPHVLQGIETYKGKKIVYSLGNFCFGGNKNPSDKDTMIYQHTFSFENDQLVKEDNQIIPCMISSTASRNNYQPTPVEGEDASRVLKKVNEIQ